MITELPVSIRKSVSFAFWFASIACGTMCCTAVASAQETGAVTQEDPLVDGKFRWMVGAPFLSVETSKLPQSHQHPWVAVKDPSIVRHDGMWHLFCTLRKQKQGPGRIRIGHLSFEDWNAADQAKWSVLDLTMGYHGAPQIFYFTPQSKWYLIYQAEDSSRGLKYGPCYSTNDDLDNPSGWTRPQPMWIVPPGVKAGLDYWAICDTSHAHLFFTSLDGRMWRSATRLNQFPDSGWSTPVIALKADIFEASHTYRLAGRDKYITIVEAIAKQRRYFKGFIADSLDGAWRPLAASPNKPLVSPLNVLNQNESWATSYSHGEFIRVGPDEQLKIDPDNLRLLFQGVDDEGYRRGNYGQIPWELGILTPVQPRTQPGDK